MATLIVRKNGVVIKSVSLDKPRSIIGQAASSDLVIENFYVNPEHASLTQIADDFVIENLNSSKATVINGKPINKYLLNNGDVIRIGDCDITFQAVEMFEVPEHAYPKKITVPDKWTEKSTSPDKKTLLELDTQHVVATSNNQFTGGKTQNSKAISKTKSWKSKAIYLGYSGLILLGLFLIGLGVQTYNKHAEKKEKERIIIEAEENYKTGLALIASGKPLEAIDKLLKSAKNGNVKSQVKLGDIYREGKEIQKNYAEAIRWYHRAIDQGNTTAQVSLGWMYANGKGVPQNDKEAVKLYRLAADQGNSIAQYNLGVTYTNGKGVSRDASEAVKWYQLAADQGFASAQYNLGIIYANGEGAPQDDKQAVKWYRLAADQGNSGAQFNLGRMYFKGKGVSQDDKEAVKWYRLAADQRNSGAQFMLGLMYANGRGITQDDSEAVKWYRLAAEQGDSGAQFMLGLMHANGTGISQDDKEAFKWFRLAADQGDADAQFMLGLMYFKGKGVPQNDNEAVKWYRLAAAQGNTEALKGIEAIEYNSNLYRQALIDKNKDSIKSAKDTNNDTDWIELICYIKKSVLKPLDAPKPISFQEHGNIVIIRRGGADELKWPAVISRDSVVYRNPNALGAVFTIDRRSGIYIYTNDGQLVMRGDCLPAKSRLY